ncbi:MAG: tetratricopeptide repeat protein [Bacteroides sp.]|nr:tetratricopeptide repeat protein [Bacteroides sp.]MCM1389761.1 tetratricopeptide repeat protein [Bacteroides sp.]
MKRLILTFGIIMLTGIISMTAQTLTQQADSAYMNDNFSKAAELYLEIAETEGTSSDLYYNLGNSYYRQGKLGKAILYYEKALRLDPSNKDARANLEFVNTKITDEPGDRGMFISNTVNGFAQKIPANTWAGIAIATFLLLLAAIAMYVFTSNIALRKTGFFGGIILLAICVIANIFASIATRYSTSSADAVIIVPSTLLSTSPRVPKDRSEEALLLHEGTVVQIIDSVTTRIDSTSTKWYDVQVDNNNRAWINGNAIERI